MNRFEFNSRGKRLQRYLGIALGRPLLGPQVVSLETTHHCNLRCSFCESHGLLLEKPITATRDYLGDRKKMDIETIQRLAHELAEAGVDLVELSGKGDPIAHPQLTEIVKAIKDAGLSCALVTNATLAKPDLAPTLIERGLDRLSVSLNAGSRESFLRSNHRDLWDKATDFLREVVALKRAAGAMRPWIRISHVVTKENVEDFDGMVQICADLGVNEVAFYVLGELPHTHHLQLEAHEVTRIEAGIARYARILDDAGVVHRIQVFAKDLALRAQLAGAATALPAGAVAVGGNGVHASEVRTNGAGADASRAKSTAASPALAQSDAYVQANPLQRKLPCYEGWMFCVIGPDGRVAPCCYCEETDLGNIHDKSFGEIWYGEAYRKYRKDSLDMPKTGRWICKECFTSCNRAVENLRIHNRVNPLRKISMDATDPEMAHS